MKTIKHFVLSAEPCETEAEKLFLPSHFSPEDRTSLLIDELASKEIELRDGQSYDCVLQLRRVEKSLSAIQGLRKKETKGQKTSTRAHTKLESMRLTRNTILATYSSCRAALQSLHAKRVDFDLMFTTQYPELTEKDLFRKSTASKRKLGDTHRPDGNIWVWSGARPARDDTEGPYFPSY